MATDAIATAASESTSASSAPASSVINVLSRQESTQPIDDESLGVAKLESRDVKTVMATELQHNGHSTAGVSRYPKYQSPTVTLLQKRRDGTIPKGAVYMLGVTSYNDLMNKKNYVDSSNKKTPVEGVKVAAEVISSQTTTTTTTSSHKPSESSNTVVLCDKPVDSNGFHRGNESGTPTSTSNQKRIDPKRIEDYEPGNSSVSSANNHNRFENQFYNPPVDKPGERCKYEDNSCGKDYTLRKVGPMATPMPSAHELYRQIQKGGLIPQQGLQLSLPAEPRRGYIVHDSRSANRELSAAAYVENIPKTRQQRDLENAMRHLRLERAVAEEKRKRVVQQQQENLARRHSDYYTPFQMAPVSLNRYDEEADSYGNSSVRNRWSSHSGSTTSRARGKARALYTFRAQNPRELSFRKGDYLYLIRQIDKNWFFGERHGIRGIFPITYVQVLVSLDQAQGLADEREGLARALYNFRPQTSVELSLQKGDMVSLIRAVDENWYEGQIGGKRGIFPASYVETLVEPDAYLMTPMTSRTVTPMQGPPSPSSSIILQNNAPAVPSAPMSPTDSELFDETQFSPVRCDVRPRQLELFHPPKSVSSIPMTKENFRDNFADDLKSLSRAYSWLDEQTASYKTDRDGLVGFGGVSGSFIGSATWSPQSVMAQLPIEDSKPLLAKNSSSSSYTQLRYPPYRVQYSYQPRNADEIEIRAGDIVYVVEMCNDGWYVGTCQRTQQFGTFPGNFVQKMR